MQLDSARLSDRTGMPSSRHPFIEIVETRNDRRDQRHAII